ncbi:hypothetical protein V492_03345 [Pseudogymnoascus sp. VKM F-4246]|nr:hypothetical protein V492_03345 [Pseudogymnoascus sp. VKM F-4246]
MPTQTSVGNGTATAGSLVEGNDASAESLRPHGQQPEVSARPPMSRPTQTNTGKEVANTRSSAEGIRTPANRSERDGCHEIYEAQREFRRLGRWVDRGSGGVRICGGVV